VESVKRFERINGREPTWDEKNGLAKILYMNLDDLSPFPKNISSDDIRWGLGFA
jgi:hypothetical protein